MFTVTQAQPSPRRESGVLVIPMESKPAAHTLTARELDILHALTAWARLRMAAYDLAALQIISGTSFCGGAAELEALAEKLEAEVLAQ